MTSRPGENGFLLALGASFSFSMMNALAKSCTLPPGQVACVRGGVGLIVTVLLIRHCGSPWLGKRPRVLLLRGLLGGFSLLLNFTALSGLPLAEATLLAHCSSLLVVLLAQFFLKEIPPRGFYVYLGLALLGVLLIIKPSAGLLHSRFAGAGLLGALTAAGASISIRNLAKDHDSYQIMLYFMAAAALVPLPFSVATFRVPAGPDWLKLLALSAVSYLGQYWLTRSYQCKEAAVVAMTRFSGVAFSVALGFLIWHEIPDRLTCLGGLLIVVACLLLHRAERLTNC